VPPVTGVTLRLNRATGTIARRLRPEVGLGGSETSVEIVTSLNSTTVGIKNASNIGTGTWFSGQPIFFGYQFCRAFSVGGLAVGSGSTDFDYFYEFHFR